MSDIRYQRILTPYNLYRRQVKLEILRQNCNIIPNLSPLQSKALFTFEFIGLDEYFQILRFLFKHIATNIAQIQR